MAEGGGGREPCAASATPCLGPVPRVSNEWAGTPNRDPSRAQVAERGIELGEVRAPLRLEVGDVRQAGDDGAALLQGLARGVIAAAARLQVADLVAADRQVALPCHVPWPLLRRGLGDLEPTAI